MGLEIFDRGELPRWARVRQQLESTLVADVHAAIAAEFARPEIRATIQPGTRVALTAGSRGIDRIAEVIAATVTQVRALGATPFIVPAMGSHGGATAEGQLDVLAHYGITPETMGCPIRSSMETVLLGEVEDNVPVFFDRIAHQEADAVIPIGRVKPHTDFNAPIESGLMKMIAIGLGKQKGADTFHARSFEAFHHLIPSVAQFSLTHVNMPFGIALVENGHGKLGIIEAIPAARIWEREQDLLRTARSWMGRLLGERIDLLLIDEIGKDISGDGADPNVINRDISGELRKMEITPKPWVQRIVIRDLTDDTDGNATGIGLGDVVLRRAFEKVDLTKTYMNAVTAKYPSGAYIPMILENDRQAIFVALGSAFMTEVETAKIARIKNTKDVEEFWASEPLLPELLATGKVELLSDPEPICFDEAGMLIER